MGVPTVNEMALMRYVLGKDNEVVQFGCDEVAQSMRERGFLIRGKRTPPAYYWSVDPEWEGFVKRHGAPGQCRLSSA